MKIAFLGMGTLVLASTLVGCSGSEEDGGAGDGGGVGSEGQATDTWAEYCVAVFNEDTAIEDGFGDALFTAKSGSTYLISRLDSPFGDGAELLYITSTGVEQFDADPASFTTDCAENSLEREYACFSDTTVYADEELTDALCSIEAGTTVPATGVSGFALAGDFVFSGPQTYEVQLSGFSEMCGGATVGYISVPESEVFGTTTWLMPFAAVSRPAP